MTTREFWAGIETIADSFQRRFLHPVYRWLDRRIFGLRWIYSEREMQASPDPEGDPVAPWVNHWIEHGLLVTVCLGGGIGALVSGWLFGPLIGAAVGATAVACWYWWREKRNGTLGTFDGRWDAITPTVWALALWMLAWGVA